MYVYAIVCVCVCVRARVLQRITDAMQFSNTI